MLCTATQPVCDMMRDCTLKPASIRNSIVCHWSSRWVPFCVNCDPKDTNPIWWKFWSNRANLIGTESLHDDSVTPSPILFGFAFLPPPPCWLWPPRLDVYLLAPSGGKKPNRTKQPNSFGSGVPAGRTWLGRLRVTLSTLHRGPGLLGTPPHTISSGIDWGNGRFQRST